MKNQGIIQKNSEISLSDFSEIRLKNGNNIIDYYNKKFQMRFKVIVRKFDGWIIKTT